jgi:16S rRNA C1402 (ribose-2'-O) methylase RsmI
VVPWLADTGAQKNANARDVLRFVEEKVSKALVAALSDAGLRPGVGLRIEVHADRSGVICRPIPGPKAPVNPVPPPPAGS